MASFLDGKIELIELNDTTWRNKVNANFTLLTAAQELDAASGSVTYTVDATPPTNSTYDHIIFAKLNGSNGNTITVTLPTPTMGRTLFFMVTNTAGSGNGLILTRNSGGSINGGTTDIAVGSVVGVGAWCVATADGWFLKLDAT